MSLLHRWLTSTSFQKIVNQQIFSSFMGWLSNIHFPKFILKSFLIGFVRNNNIDMSQYILDIDSAKTFNEFFTRHLKPGQRSIEGEISSPADGFVSAFGKVENNQLFQIKGNYFPLDELIRQKSSFDNGSFTTVYLSPSDYHRVHMPFDAKITGIQKIYGKLFSVNKKTIESIENIYCKNERIVLQGTSKFGNFYLVLVGAIVVGKIILTFTQQKLKFNEIYSVDFDLKQGDEVGYFELGSTVLIVSESDNLANINYSLHQKVYLGNKLC